MAKVRNFNFVVSPRASVALLLGVLFLLPGCGSDERDADTAVDLQRFPEASLILISLDTLRADGVGVLGGPKGISPTLDRFASESVIFTHARAPAPHTAPSHMSMFTSTYPSVHGVQNVQFGDAGPLIQPLKSHIPTLAETLQAAGFSTVGLTDGGNLNPAHGFARGFETYTRDLSGVDAQISEALPEIEKLSDSEKRFFLLWHTYEIHSPYAPPSRYIENWAPKSYDGELKQVVEGLEGQSFAERWGSMKTRFWKNRASFGWVESAYLHGLYKAGIRYTDDRLARLFEGLRKSGLLDRSIVVIMSDHGEEFFEHGRWQHEQLFEECLRVPLFIRLPGGVAGGTRIDTPVSLMDIMPTVLDLLEVDVEPLELSGPVRLAGTSLAPAMLGEESVRERPIVSELRVDREGGGEYQWMVAVHQNGFKFIHDRYRGERPDHRFEYLYDLSSDPDERSNLISKMDEVQTRFKETLDGFFTGLEVSQNPDAAMAEITLEILEQLEQLGYIDGAAAVDMRQRLLESERDSGPQRAG